MFDYDAETDNIVAVTEEAIERIGNLDISPVDQDELTELLEEVQESAKKIKEAKKAEVSGVVGG